MMKKILQKTVLVSAVSLATLSAQKVMAIDNSQTSSNSSSISTSKESSSSNSVILDNQIKEKNKNNSESQSVIQDSTILKQNTEIGPGYYADDKLTTRSALVRTDTQGFIDHIRAGAIAGWNKYGVLPSVSGAQAILESSWGQSLLATEGNNLFGIKGEYNGQYTIMQTQEFVNGQYITVNAKFRKYPSWNESIEDHGNFLASNSRYNNLLHVTNYKEVTRLLQSDGYATAPTYATSLNRIIEQYHLYDWDNSVMDVNSADLNAAIVEGNHIHVKGWHVNSKAANQQNSFLFLLDANTKAEVKRYRIQRKNRQDVKNAFPNVTSALNSGFDEEIPVTDDMYGRKLVVMSRYSGDINGNLNNTDYLFNNNVISFPDATASHLDTFKIANNKIEITGWHASTASRTAQSSYLILMDASNGQEYKRYKITRTARPDVQAAVPYIYNSLNSGFKLEIPITSDMHGKTFKVISRYASQDNGQGSLSDVNFDQTIGLNENISSINDGWMDANMLHVRGWHAIDDIANKPYHTLIFMDASTNSELSRTTVTNTQRPDVQQAYPNIANSLNSGFSADINLTAKMKGKKIYVLSRYSKTANPNQDFIDSRLSRDISTFSTNESAENVGNIDELTSNGATLKVRGWHAANATKGKQYHFLILMDRNSNQEIKRIKVTNEKRTDVRAAVPYLYNSLNSGFNTNISITNDLKGRYIYVLSRYTSDSAGNNNTVDYLGNKTLLVK
ncbi:hypothetical protein GKC31_03470 [Lactobacillus curvatus]|nr:hypothetical protein [Latilactobacillus curvatus]